MERSSQQVTRGRASIHPIAQGNLLLFALKTRDFVMSVSIAIVRRPIAANLIFKEQTTRAGDLRPRRGRHSALQDCARRPRRRGPHGLSEIVYAYASSVADMAQRSQGSTPTRPGATSRPALRCFSGALLTPYRFWRSPDRSRRRRRPNRRLEPFQRMTRRSWSFCSASSRSLRRCNTCALALGPVAEHFLPRQGALC